MSDLTAQPTTPSRTRVFGVAAAVFAFQLLVPSILLKLFSGFIGEVPPLHFGFFFTATIVPVLSYFLFKPLAGKLFAKCPCTLGIVVASLVLTPSWNQSSA